MKLLLTILSLASAILAVFTLLLIVVTYLHPFALSQTLVGDGVVIIEWSPNEVAINGEPPVEIHGALGVYYYLHRRLPPPSNSGASSASSLCRTGP